MPPVMLEAPLSLHADGPPHCMLMAPLGKQPPHCMLMAPSHCMLMALLGMHRAMLP